MSARVQLAVHLLQARTELMPLESRQLLKRVRDYDDFIGLESERESGTEMEGCSVDMYVYARSTRLLPDLPASAWR